MLRNRLSPLHFVGGLLLAAALAACDTTAPLSSPDLTDQSRLGERGLQAEKERAARGQDPRGPATPAQSAFYTVEQISYQAGPSNLANPGPTGDDQLLANVPIGFDFEFYGTSYNTLHISSNGFVRFGSPSGDSGCCSGRTIPLDDAWNNLIGVAWTDLNPAHVATGEVRYETRGTAPNRQFIVHYHDVTIWPNTDPRLNAWLVLHEGSNVIEIHTDFLNPGSQNVTQGIENAQGTDAAYVQGRVAAVFSLNDDAVRFSPLQYEDVEIDAVYSESQEPNDIYLGDEWVYVEILGVEQYIPTPASASDVRIGGNWDGGTPAESYVLGDFDGDGARDIRLRFSLDALVDAGHLTVHTTGITVWGRDPNTGDLYRGTADVDVTAPPRGELLWNNGGMITHPGAGFGGADVSMASEDLQGSTAGVNVRHFPPDPHFRVADDFVVGADGWNVGLIITHAYQTGGVPTWTRANMNIRRGSHTGAIVASTTTTTWEWTGIYRVFYGTANLTNRDRPIYEIHFDFGDLRLDPGTYWIDWQVEGGASGWAPFVMQVDNGEPVTPAGNAMQLTDTGWAAFYAPDTAESPFLVYRTGTEHVSPGRGKSPAVAPLPLLPSGYAFQKADVQR